MSPLLVATGPQYSAAPLGRRHTPVKARPFSEYRECIRLDFAFTCAYCLSREAEVGPGATYGGFEIEHFKPSSLPGFERFENVYSNLLWACRACNLAKSDTWPSREEEKLGARFVDPSSEALGEHLKFEGHDVVAVAGSAAGRYMITELNLNSKLQVRRRQEREKAEDEAALIEALCDDAERAAANDPANAAALARLANVRAVLQRIREKHLLLTRPWDAPDHCRFRCGTASPVVRRRRLARRDRKRLARKQTM